MPIPYQPYLDTPNVGQHVMSSGAVGGANSRLLPKTNSSDMKPKRFAKS